MTAIIEWTHDAQCAARAEKIALGIPRWSDDHLHGILCRTDKEYDFFAAIAGVRSRFNKLPLIPPRGLPTHVSWSARLHFEGFDDDGVAGWLHLSEIERAIEHMGVDRRLFGFELEVGLELMTSLVQQLADPHVRMVFEIESA